MTESDEKSDLKNFLSTPKNLEGESLETKALALTLHFIGGLPKPYGLTDGIYERCLEAFNANRGKFEWEEAAVYKALKGDLE